jgi:hypothetical protein
MAVKHPVMNIVERDQQCLWNKNQVCTRIKIGKNIYHQKQIATPSSCARLPQNPKMPKFYQGVGTKCTVLTRFIHPSEHVRDKHANLETAHKTVVLLIGEETYKVNQKEQTFYTFRCDDYPNIILYVVMRYAIVVTEGPPESFFNYPTGHGANNVEAAAMEVRNMPPRTNNHNEDIQLFTALGTVVDDDNLPTPENVPPPNEHPPGYNLITRLALLGS